MRELIGAGHYGLLLAADRFRPDAGVRFITASAPSIRREIISKAKLDAKGRGVTRPYDVKFSPDILLDGLRGSTDSEMENSPMGQFHRDDLSASFRTRVASKAEAAHSPVCWLKALQGLTLQRQIRPR